MDHLVERPDLGREGADQPTHLDEQIHLDNRGDKEYEEPLAHQRTLEPPSADVN